MSSTSQNSIGFGLVGCGRISAIHLDSIEKIPECTLVSVCDIDEAKAKEVADRHGAWYGADYRHMPLDDVDVVSIFAGDHSFAALKTDDSLVTWGGSTKRW